MEYPVNTHVINPMYYGIPLKFKMGSHYHPISNFPMFILLSHCYPIGIWLPGASGLNAIETPPIWQTAKINKKTYCVQFFLKKAHGQDMPGFSRW
jgi:hypothetical protein